MLGLSIPSFAYRQPTALAARVNALFRSGEQGVWYDPSDRATMFQDAAGITPVTAIEQPVGLVLDKSGRGNHAFQSTSASRPVLSARVNLLKKTEQFDDAVWVKGNASIDSVRVTAPNGTLTAQKLVENTANGTHQLYAVQAMPTAPNTFSIYVKAAGRSKIHFGGNWALIDALIDLETGEVSGIGASRITVTPGTNGWWRIVSTDTPPDTAGRSYAVRLNNGASDTYTGDGTSGIYIWGADLRPTNTGVNLPPYQRVNTATDYDTAGFPHYLKFDGIDDSLVTNSIDFTATDKMTVCAGVRKLSDATYGQVVELSVDWFSNNGTFAISAPFGNAASSYAMVSKGTTAVARPATYYAPHTAVLTGFANISAPLLGLKVNGGAALTYTSSQGTGNYGNYPIYIGRRGGTTLPFNGHLYQLIIRGAASSNSQIVSVELYINGKTKAYA